jgi:hypothetical protein
LLVMELGGRMKLFRAGSWREQRAAIVVVAGGILAAGGVVLAIRADTDTGNQGAPDVATSLPMATSSPDFSGWYSHPPPNDAPPHTRSKTPYVDQPTPTLAVPSVNSLEAAKARLGAEAPEVLELIEHVEAGNVEGIVDLLTFERRECTPRTAERPFAWCLRGRGSANLVYEEMDVFAWNAGNAGITGTADWQTREDLIDLLKRILGENRRSLEFLAKRNDGSYTAVFAVDTRVVWRPGHGEGTAPKGLWFQIPPGLPPRDLYLPSWQYREHISEFFGRLLERIHEHQARWRSDPAWGHQYDIWWVSQEQLDQERAR